MDKPYKIRDVKGFQEDMGLGSLLRATREERNIGLDEVAKATMVRPQNLEALENEEWSKLPSPVFVKGFLQSYAEFLRLDKELVLQYYLKASPHSRYQPRMLKEMGTQSGRWRWKFAIVVLSMAFVAAFFYLRSNSISVIEKAFQYLEIQSAAKNEETIAQEKASGNRDYIQKQERLIQDKTIVEQERKTASELKSGEDTVAPEALPISIEAEDKKPSSPEVILIANITSRTWVAIRVDDELVKEYLFQPGESMRWVADKGFDLLVGNAGGIDLFLNGEHVGCLGPEGKVVRVRLPDGYGEGDHIKTQSR